MVWLRVLLPSLLFRARTVGLHVLRRHLGATPPHARIRGGEGGGIRHYVYNIAQQEGDALEEVIASITSLFGTRARTLFDTGASHLFISCSFARDHSFTIKQLSPTFRVKTPGNHIDVDKNHWSWPVLLGNQVFLANLKLIPPREFDEVLRMD